LKTIPLAEADSASMFSSARLVCEGVCSLYIEVCMFGYIYMFEGTKDRLRDSQCTGFGNILKQACVWGVCCSIMWIKTTAPRRSWEMCNRYGTKERLNENQSIGYKNILN
jgi:hypothetical protein